MKPMKLVIFAAAAVVAGGLMWWTTRPVPQQATGSPRLDGPAGPASPSIGRALRVLHVMSYEADWTVWTMAQFDAFRAELAGLDVEYRVVELGQRRNSGAEIDAKVREAHAVIESWRPDLVYVTDDLAMDRLVRDYVDTDLPFVFSGVNRSVEHYGLAGSRNVTGVLEREHIEQTLQLFAALNPGATRLAIVTDMGETWPGVIQRFRDLESRLPLKIVAVDVLETFEEYQKKMGEYEGKLDAVCTLGVFLFKDGSGENVPLERVGRWTYEHSTVANLSFWDSRPEVGALCVVAVSGKAQGEAAGRIARGILAEGRSPSSFAVEATRIGRPIINLAVARKLGLSPSSSLLLSSEVTDGLAWDKP